MQTKRNKMLSVRVSEEELDRVKALAARPSAGNPARVRRARDSGWAGVGVGD